MSVFLDLQLLLFLIDQLDELFLKLLSFLSLESSLVGTNGSRVLKHLAINLVVEVYVVDQSGLLQAKSSVNGRNVRHLEIWIVYVRVEEAKQLLFVKTIFAFSINESQRFQYIGAVFAIFFYKGKLSEEAQFVVEYLA